MRLPALLLAIAFVAPAASADEPYPVLHDWTSGESLVGATALAPTAPEPIAHALRFAVDACHPRVLLDLLYDPAELAVDVDGLGEVALGLRFRAQAWMDGEMVGERTIGAPGYGYAVAVVPAAGDVELRFWLVDGANVEWQARVRGQIDPACQPV